MTSREERDRFLEEGPGRRGEGRFQRQVGKGSPVSKVGAGEKMEQAQRAEAVDEGRAGLRPSLACIAFPRISPEGASPLLRELVHLKDSLTSLSGNRRKILSQVCTGNKGKHRAERPLRPPVPP